MSKVSFEDIGSVVATFKVDEGVVEGDAVKVTTAGSVGFCGKGEWFCGTIKKIRKDVASVQLRGFMEVKTEVPINPGHVKLVSNGHGGVQSADEGMDALVVKMNYVTQTAIIYL